MLNSLVLLWFLWPLSLFPFSRSLSFSLFFSLLSRFGFYVLPIWFVFLTLIHQCVCEFVSAAHHTQCIVTMLCTLNGQLFFLFKKPIVCFETSKQHYHWWATSRNSFIQSVPIEYEKWRYGMSFCGLNSHTFRLSMKLYTELFHTFSKGLLLLRICTRSKS